MKSTKPSALAAVSLCTLISVGAAAFSTGAFAQTQQPATGAQQPAAGAAQPAQPADPAQPATGTAQPADPAQPMQPATGTAQQPADPAQPATGLSQPATPAQPAAETAQPADPAQPAAASTDSGTMERADEDMRTVLQKLMELGAKPIETLTVEQARTQPTPADAVMAVMQDQNIPTPQPAVTTQDIMIPGAAGDLPARVYIPEGEGPFPVVLYFHGGGWVIADIDVYDATPRAMADKTKAIFISSHYRQAPENPFPAAHDDAIAVYKWVVENSGQFNADTSRIAVMGESAGGGLAAHVAIQARDQALQQPMHQALIYPVAGTDMNTPSYQENANAMPLSKAGMMWFMEKVDPEMDDQDDPRLDLVGEAEVSNLPPATIVTAEIDPLRSEGEMLAEKLEAAGVDAEIMNYEGATHEFFGMAAVVDDAEQAQQFVADRLTAAFGQ